MTTATGRMPFVGRVPESTVLSESLTAATAGQGRVVLLAGEPGIGKTRLAEECAAAASAQGARVLWGRCYEGEGAPAFWPWVQILRALLRDARASEVQRAFADGDAPEIVALVPELLGEIAGLPATTAPDSASARFRLFESVTNALIAGGDLTTVLVLDDLHWADVPSLLLLRFVAREIRDARILILGTYRDIEVGRQDPLAKTLGELARLPHVHRLGLRGLGEAEVADFIAAMTGVSVPAPVVRAVWTETEGNPFFLAEVLRLLAGEGRLAEPQTLTVESMRTGVPEGVREVIDRRLDRLSADCNWVLTVAAVVGREFRITLLASITGLDTDRLLEAIDEAESARIVAATDVPAWYRFTHALIWETLYDELPTARRARLHRRVGEALQEFCADAPEPYLAELAHHFLRAIPAGEVETAVEYARRAGDHALALLAYEEAAEHYGRALGATSVIATRDEWRRCGLLLALGDARMRAGDTPAAQAACVEAAEVARSLGRSGSGHATQRAASLLAQAALGYGRAGVQTGLVDRRLVALLEEALAMQDGADDVQRVRLLGRLAMELYFGDDRERRAALSAEALAMARRLGDPATLAFALHARHLALWEPENIDERLALCAELPAVAEAAGDAEMVLQGYILSVPDLLEAGEIEAAKRSIDAYARLAEELRQPLFRWHATRLRALRAYLDGRFEEMERLVREALAIAERAQIGGADVLFVSQLQFLRREQGRYAEMETPIEEVIARYPRLAESWRLTLANLYAQTGRIEEARRVLDAQAASGFASLGRALYSLGVTALLAEAIVAAGDRDAAGVVYERLLPYASRYLVNAAVPNFYGAASHYLGGLAATMGRVDAAVEHFETALAMNRRTGVRPTTARTQYELAAALVARGHPVDRARAMGLAVEARATALELGMGRLAEQTILLSDERGAMSDEPAAPPSDVSLIAPRSSLPNGLTAREAEVLRLLATGMSNREIAAALVVTVNTVERHLVSIYGKLGAKGRSAATAYALRHGIV